MLASSMLYPGNNPPLIQATIIQLSGSLQGHQIRMRVSGKKKRLSREEGLGNE